MKLPDKLHVPDPEKDRHYPFDYSVFYDDPEQADRYDFVFTVSPVPDRAGWETDSGTEGYGIPRKLAEEIAFRYNDFPAMLRVVEAAREAEKQLRRRHHVCEDSWYSCPASGDCINEQAGKECWCGADKDNAMADKLAQALADYDSH